MIISHKLKRINSNCLQNRKTIVYFYGQTTGLTLAFFLSLILLLHSFQLLTDWLMFLCKNTFIFDLYSTIIKVLTLLLRIHWLYSLNNGEIAFETLLILSLFLLFFIFVLTWKLFEALQVEKSKIRNERLLF